MTKNLILKMWYSGLSKYQIANEEYKDLKRHSLESTKILREKALKNVEDVLYEEWLNLSKKK